VKERGESVCVRERERKVIDRVENEENEMMEERGT
jgi:hypothetical protein